MTEARPIVAKGIIGTLAPLLGMGASFADQVELYLRLSSLAVGLAVGIVTLISLWRRKP